MYFSDFFPLVSSICVFFLSFLVLWKNRKSRVNFTFFLHGLVISVWLFATFMMFMNRDDPGKAIFWDRLVYSGVAFIPVCMYHFGLAFMNRKRDFFLYFGYFLSVIFFFLSRTDYFVSGIFEYKWGVHTKAQFFHHIFLGYFVSYVIIWFIQIVRYYLNLRSAAQKLQAKYILVGFLFLFAIGPIAFLPAYGIGIYPFSYISGLIFTIILSYAIVRHRLMDIKVVIRQSSVYIASIVTVMLGVFVIRLIFLGEVLREHYLLDFFTFIFAISSFPLLQKIYYTFANRYLFTSLYDSRQVMTEMSNELTSTLELNKIYKLVSNMLIQTFHSQKIAFLIHDSKKDRYELDFNKGFKTGKQKYFDGNKILNKKFVSKNELIVLEEILDLKNKKAKETIELLQKLKVSVLAPLNVGKKTIGLIALGEKETKDAYNQEDIQLLDVVRAQVAIAVQNALAYQEIKDFSKKLAHEVKIATKELRVANKKLKKLDAAKSEFISIASHQLRTPLTSIKGFTSLLREGAYGKISTKQLDVLEKVFISNERLIMLVEDLLNISRIEKGKMQYDLENVDLRELIENSLKILQIQAKNKKLKLKYIDDFKHIEEPQRAPIVYADYKKLSEVIGNLIDNAIKYTQEGTVTIKLEAINSHLALISVKDSGIGINPAEIPKLFEKFSRASNATRYHANGTGLGLFVAKQITQAHGGRIWAQSEGEDKGSTFFLELPLKQKGTKQT